MCHTASARLHVARLTSMIRQVVVPNLTESVATLVRASLVRWFQQHPDVLRALLDLSADDARVPPAVYLRRLASDLWCGMPELAAWSIMHNIKVCVVDKNNATLWSSTSTWLVTAGRPRPSVVMRLSAKHFTLATASQPRGAH
eukprot:2886586-Amphidinium_carterae.2